MKKKIFAALAASVMLCGVLTVPAAADTAAAEENKTAVTQPVSSDEIREKELFGLSVDASAFTLNVGETRELKVSLNTDYYLADSLHFYSDDQSVAWVYPYIGGHVIGTSAGTAAIQVSARLDKNTRFEKDLTQQQLLDIMIGSYRLSPYKMKLPNKLHIVCKPRGGFSINNIWGVE